MYAGRSMALAPVRTIRDPWAEFQAWFQRRRGCLDYLEWLRLPGGGLRMRGLWPTTQRGASATAD